MNIESSPTHSGSRSSVVLASSQYAERGAGGRPRTPEPCPLSPERREPPEPDPVCCRWDHGRDRRLFRAYSVLSASTTTKQVRVGWRMLPCIVPPHVAATFGPWPHLGHAHVHVPLDVLRIYGTALFCSRLTALAPCAPRPRSAVSCHRLQSYAHAATMPSQLPHTSDDT